MKKSFQLQLLPALLCVAFSGTASAAGFQLQNQNGAGTGLAYAGQAANPEDASTVFFNPAGMTYLPAGQNIAIGATIIDRSVDFTNNGTTGAALGTGNGGSGGGHSVIPAFFYTRDIDSKWKIGVGVSPTFGSKTEFDAAYIAKFSGFYSSIKQTNINPSVSYRMSDTVSLGAGINIAKNETEIRQAASPFGHVATLKGDANGYGWNAGALFKVDDKTTLGVSYRSKVHFKLEGTLVNTATSTTTPIFAWLTTPDTLSFAFSHKANDKLEWLGDLTRTGWNTLEALRAYNSTTNALVASSAYNFMNTWRAGLGAKYQYNEKWNLRAGVAYDQSPVPDAASRSLTLPDSDRIWLSFGARMKLDNKSSVDMGYARVMLKDSSTARVVAAPPQVIRGDFKSSVNLFSAQYNVNF